ncbi:MAG: GGDEF domain-containing protein [Firmicutes bacterium]|nr:GGDEF domain-containing protein [Bacillota bacterium]
MIEGLHRVREKKDTLLYAAVLICLALCIVTGFPALPYTKQGLGETLDAAALRHFCWKNLFAVSFFFFSTAAGIAALSVGFALRSSGPENRSLVTACRQLGLFVILSGIWMLTDSPFLSLFTQNRDAISFLSFASFMLMPLPLLRFFDYLLPGQRKIWIMDWLFSANLCVFLVLSALKAGSVVYLVLLGIHHVLIIVTIASAWWHQFRERGLEQQRIWPPSGLLLFFVFSLVSVLVFLMGLVEVYPVTYGIGLICLMFFVFRKLMKRMLRVLKERAELDRFKEMAYTDALCQIGNRSAFLQEQQATADMPELCYVVLDLNGLKRVNDQLGHSAGDYLIHAAAQAIQDTFADSGKCYRTGGDEFAVICTELDEPGLLDVLDKLEQTLAQCNLHQQPPLSLAWGYAIREAPEDTAEILYQKADDRMYACKQRQGAARGG